MKWSINSCTIELFRPALPVWMVLIFVGTLITSCKKEINVPPTEIIPEERSDDQKLLDSIYYYYHLYSLWTDVLVKHNPVSEFIDQQRRTPNELLATLMHQTPRHSGIYSGPLDHFSYIDQFSSSSTSARADNADGYGLYWTTVAINDTTGYAYAYFVEGGSPAALAGVTRGFRVTKINGTEINIPLEKRGDQLVIATGSNHRLIDNALSASRFNMEAVDLNGDRQTYELTYRTYAIDPFLKDTIFDNYGNKTGYFALSSFEEIAKDGAFTELYHQINRTFTKFDQAGIENLIVDFRYNIGGYVNTAEIVSDFIVNNNGDGKLMYKYETNSYLKSRSNPDASDFDDVYFHKRTSTMDLKKVYFLVTENTASASEIVISALMPYFDTFEIIAEEKHTYGKPVGFFPQEIMGKLDLWVTSFKIVNADGYTDYWDGIAATKGEVIDDILRDFGDSEETMTQLALYHAKYGRYPTEGNQARQTRAARSSSRQPTVQKIQLMNTRPVRNLLKR